MPGTLAPLQVRPFGRLLTSYTINEIGDSIGIVALALLVHAQTGSALATAGLFLGLNVGPAFIAPVLTARLEEIPLSRVLPVIYTIEAIVFAALGLLADDAFLLPLVLLLGLVDGTLALCGRGLTRAAVGAMLEPHGQLRSGNALLNTGYALASVGGAALGGLIAGTSGIAMALYVNAVSFFLIAVLMASARGLPRVAGMPQPLRSKVREGLAFIAGQPRARLLIGGEAVALVLFTLIVPIEVFYARDTLGASEAGYGLLLASWGAGMVLGSLIFMVGKHWPLALLVLGSTAMIGIAYSGMAAVDTLAAACALSVLGGAGNGVQWVAVVTALQESTPVELQARVMAVLESVNRFAPALGFVIGGLLVNAFSPRTAFATAGIGVLLLVMIGGAVGLARLRQSAESAA